MPCSVPEMPAGNEKREIPMDEYSFRKMNRKKLLELLERQLSENAELKAHAAALEKQLAAVQEDCARQLADRKITLSRAGTMAEAALQLNRVFTDADLAARQYLENVRRSSDNAEALVKTAKETASREADTLLAEARAEAEKIRAEAGVQAQAILDGARHEAEQYQKDAAAKMSELYNSYKGLRSIFSAWGEKSEK